MKNFKKVISAVVALALSASTFVSASSFTDVADTASYAEAIDVLSALGIVNGYAEDDGTYTFKPEGSITRAEAATMIVGALNMTADAQASAGTSKFADVNTQASWATGYVNVGVSQGFINGMDDTTFAPQDGVTYAQMCVMLTSIAGYGDYAAANGGWPAGYTTMAASTGINKGVAVANDTELTRGQVAQMIWNTLQAPMLDVNEYSIVGNTYAPQDGKSDRGFKTLLSDKFDGYVATAKINATATSTNGTLDSDEVDVDVTKADWFFDEKALPNTTYPNGLLSQTYKFVGVDVDSALLQTGKAVFVENDDDDIVMVYFATTGKTKTAEYDAEDYVMQEDIGTTSQFAAGTNQKIRFGSKYVKLDDSVALYINGKSVKTLDTDNTAKDNENKAIFDAVLGNAVGTITLIDDGTTSGYDAIMVDYYGIAKVAGVEYANAKTTVTMTTKNYLDGTAPNAKFSNAVTGITTKQYDTIVIDDEEVEDGKVVLSVEKNGKAVELTSLVKGDIIAYKTDMIGTTGTKLSNPVSLQIIATDETVSGKVSAKDTEEKTVTIDGTEYKAVVWSGLNVDLSENYDITLDPFGRIYAAEKTGSSALYGIALGVTIDGNVKIIRADGTQKSFGLESGAVKDTKAFLTGTGTGTGSESDLRTYLADGSHKANERIVSYKVRTSTGEITSIEVVKTASLVNYWATNGEYKARTAKLDGGITIAADTAVIDARNAQTDPEAGSNYSAFNVENFKDGSDYKYVAIKTNNYTNLVVINAVGTKINEDSRFAVVIKAGTPAKTDDGDDVDRVEVLLNGQKTTLDFTDGYYATSTLAVGDAFYYDVNSYGQVNKVFKIFTKASKTFTELGTAIGASVVNDYIDTTEWDYTLDNTGNKDIQLVQGYVMPGADGVMTFAYYDERNNGVLYKVDTNSDYTSSNKDGVAIFSVADDAELYMYDSNSDEAKEINKYSIKGDASVLASTSLEKYEDNGIYGVVDKDSSGNPVSPATYTTVNMASEANYAIALIVDEVVVTAYVIK